MKRTGMQLPASRFEGISSELMTVPCKSIVPLAEPQTSSLFRQPFSLDWMYVESPEKVSVDRFEEFRAGTRRMQVELKMPQRVRHILLMDNWDVSMRSILEASRATKRERETRVRTAKKAQRQMRKEELLKSAYKPLMKIFRKKAKEIPKYY
jgi:hypothetical protein